MREVEYLQMQAKKLRELADGETNPDVKRELMDLADRCEKLANHLHGNGARDSRPNA